MDKLADKIAFVFAGQGAQYAGMGKALYERSAAARAVFDMAEGMRPGTKQQCFCGSDEALALTQNTQPCLYCVDMAAAAALSEAGIQPSAVAGFSLGETAALTYADVFSDEAGFSYVCKRAEAMAEAAGRNPGFMAAILKLSNETVEQICRELPQVYPVNYNCPGQLVVAGINDSMDALNARVAEAGGRFKQLKVSGGFHSPFMAAAEEKMSAVIAEIPLKAASVPVYANRTAKPFPAEPECLKDEIVKQMTSPVRWEDTVLALSAQGITTFIEVGAGKTLSGLIKKTIKGARILNVQDAESLDRTLAEVRA